MRVRGFALLLGLALPAVLEGQQGGWVGCYDVVLEGWNMPLGGDSLIFTPPPRIQLDAIPSADRMFAGSSFQLRPAPGSPPTRHRFAAWTSSGADSLRLVWSTGFAGVDIRGVREGTGFRGRARSHVDVMGTPPHTADAIGTRVDCASPMPEQHASWRRYPTRVPLESGDTLTLGEAIPRRILGAAERDPSGRQIVRSRPLGIFAGATHARLAASDGIIRRIEVLFDPATDMEALSTRIAEAIGPPTGRFPEPGGSVYWSGREDVLFSLGTNVTIAGEREAMITLISTTR